MGPDGVVDSRGGVMGSLLMCMPLRVLTVMGETWPPTMPCGTGLQQARAKGIVSTQECNTVHVTAATWFT